MNKKLFLTAIFIFLFGMMNTFAQNCNDGYRTYTNGGWGTKCGGGNAGCYRDANFSAAFPNGLTIGCGSNTLTLTSSSAVEAFLPSGTSARVLNAGSMVNPGGTYSNVLAGQLVAVSLEAGFDAYDPNFSTNTNSFSNLIIANGAFSGMTVGSFLQVANQVIGGCSTAYTLSDVNATATMINENYDNGTINNGNLICNNNTFRLYTIKVDSNINCFGYLNGQVTVTIEGGLAPYVYTLNNGQTSGSVNSTSYTFTGLAAGNYTVTVTDANGIISSGNDIFNVLQPTQIVVSTSATNVSCYGDSNGSATISNISGGIAPYTILWSNGDATNSLTGLSAGTYQGLVTDSLGCTMPYSVIIAQPDALSSSTSVTNVSCYGGSNGSATVTPQGGTAPYTILWDNQSTDFTRAGLSANVTYTAVVTDANGCQTNVSTSVTEPTLLTSSTSVTDVSCYDGSNGSATVTPQGGTAPYTILWDNQSTDFTRAGLSANVTYTAVVTDANGCQTNVATSVTEPTLLTSSTSVTDVSCYGGSNGSSTVTPQGGTAPYTILWDNQSTDFTRAGLSANVNYTAVVTDAHGCQTNVATSVTEPTLLTSLTSVTNVSCYGGSNGSATVTPQGGTAPYTILWNNGSTDFTRSGLSANVNYTAVVTDANGCQINVSKSVTQPMALAISIAKTNVTCYGGYGSATATVTGGTAPYTYSWNTNPVQSTQTADLKVGTWTVSITDANGCTASANVTLVLLSCEGFTTVTQGGYGTKCAGNNWGCYLVNNFASKFPYGITIGSGSRFIKFTSAAAVQAFLPSGSTARVLNVGTLTNPTTKTYNNVLAGQAVALTLSVGFDANTNFSPSSTSLGSLVVASGTFAGKTVNQLLSIANTILGGGSSIYTVAQITAALDTVNKNYDNGTVNLGYLACPCTDNTSKMAYANSNNTLETSAVLYPNPVNERSFLDFTINYDSNVKVELYNMNGQLVGTIYTNEAKADNNYSVTIEGSTLSSGMYILKLSTDREVINKTLVVSSK
jgi:hypothetical protein